MEDRKSAAGFALSLVASNSLERNYLPFLPTQERSTPPAASRQGSTAPAHTGCALATPEYDFSFGASLQVDTEDILPRSK